jgi:hypothetical protein
MFDGPVETLVSWGGLGIPVAVACFFAALDWALLRFRLAILCASAQGPTGDIHGSFVFNKYAADTIDICPSLFQRAGNVDIVRLFVSKMVKFGCRGGDGKKIADLID